MGKFSIGIKNATFYAFHGVYAAERAAGHHFAVSLSVDFDQSYFSREDLETTINYEVLFQIVDRRMAQSSKLLETVACDIIETCKKEWPHLLEVKIKIEKIGVQLGGKLENSFVELIA